MGGSILVDKNSKLEPGSWIQDPGSGIQDPGLWILDPGILNPGSWIQDPLALAKTGIWDVQPESTVTAFVIPTGSGYWL